jgi:hypothetical protein
MLASYVQVWLSSDVLELAQRGKPGKCLAFELADPLAGQVELVADRLESPGLALEAEPQLQDPALPLRKGIQGTPHALAT